MIMRNDPSVSWSVFLSLSFYLVCFCLFLPQVHFGFFSSFPLCLVVCKAEEKERNFFPPYIRFNVLLKKNEVFD